MRGCRACALGSFVRHCNFVRCAFAVATERDGQSPLSTFPSSQYFVTCQKPDRTKRSVRCLRPDNRTSFYLLQLPVIGHIILCDGSVTPDSHSKSNDVRDFPEIPAAPQLRPFRRAAISAPATSELPLQGIRVVEFGHTIMGPSCALLLADLGATVIKVEPVDGERTRTLAGFGAGYFDFFNRNKRSFAVDIKSQRGRALASWSYIPRSDVLVENFAPGAMARLNLGYDDIAARFPRLIYCSLKRFLLGPDQDRVALDETAQMMSGLAYMTALCKAAVRRRIRGRHHGGDRGLRHSGGAAPTSAHRARSTRRMCPVETAAFRWGSTSSPMQPRWAPSPPTPVACQRVGHLRIVHRS